MTHNKNINAEELPETHLSLPDKTEGTLSKAFSMSKKANYRDLFLAKC